MVKLPFKFRNATLDDFGAPADPARAFVERIASIEPRIEQRPQGGMPGAIKVDVKVYDFRGTPGLLIVGTSGTGKTHMAAAIANDLPRTANLWFRSGPEIIEEAHDAVRSGGEPSNYGRHGGVLILDDLTAVRPTEFALDVISRVIRTRYDEGYPTVATTHASHEDLEGMYGLAVASRLLEFGPVVKLEGEDRRRQGATQRREAQGGRG